MSSTVDGAAPGLGTPTPPEGYEADADKIIEAIERPQRWTGETIQTPDDRTVEREEPTKWRWMPKGKLPAFGDEGDDCGETIVNFCTDCGHTHDTGSTCYQSVCPRCGAAWCMRQSKEIVAKLKAVWAYQYISLDEHPYFHHLVISLPDDLCLDGDPETVYWRILDVVKDILEELGVAGIPFYHPYRGESEEADTDIGEWKDRLFNGRAWEGDVADELEFSPHFHVLGVSPHVDIGCTKQIEEETGWIIERIQDDDGISVANDYALARKATYCLSHTMLYEDTNGDMSAAYHPRVSERVPDGRPTIQDETRAEADQLVKSVAPKVLGVDFNTIACTAKVPKDLVDEAARRINLAAGSNSPCSEGAGESDRGEHSDDRDDLVDVGSGDGESDSRIRCEGDRVHISNAQDYLEDEEWRDKAVHAADLQKKYAEWLQLHGIPT